MNNENIMTEKNMLAEIFIPASQCFRPDKDAIEASMCVGGECSGNCQAA